MRQQAKLFSRDYLVEGTADGGTWTRLERKRGGRGEVVRFSRSPLDAAQVGELLASLDAAEWWAMSDGKQPTSGMVLAQSLEVRRGSTLHRFEVSGPCYCEARCACPQARALDAANVFFHRARVEKAEKLAPTVFPTLALPALSVEDGGTALREVDCEVGPGKALACEKKKCVRQGKQAVWFSSSFEAAADAGVEWVTVRREKKSRADGWGPAWALRTASGRQCVQRPFPGTTKDPWVCEPESPKVARLFWVGKTLMLETADPEWSVDAVVEAWR
jgi:hypothetical protein